MVCIKFLSTELYASYALAFFGIPGIQQIYSSIGNVYLLEIANAFKNNDLVKALHSFKELTTKTFALTVPVVWITCLYAEEIIVFLFTDRYLDAVPLFRIHIFGFIVLMLGTSLVIRASGQTKYSLYSYLYPAVFTLPCTYFAVKYYGVYGGIISTMFAQIMPKIFQAVYEIRLLETNWRYYLPWKNFGTNILIATVILLPFYVLHRFMQFNVFISGALAGLYLVIVLFLQLKFEIAVINKDAVSRILTRFHLGYFARFI